MLDILLDIGAGLLGGLIGLGIGYALSRYLERAKEWFDNAWKRIQRIRRAVGILVRRESRLFKLFIVETNGGEEETYYEEDDEGVEIEWDELSDEAKKALEEDEYIPVQYYE